jgi:hypothetical protein
LPSKFFIARLDKTTIIILSKYSLSTDRAFSLGEGGKKLEKKEADAVMNEKEMRWPANYES